MQFTLSSTVVILPALLVWIFGTAYFQVRRSFHPSPVRYLVLTGFVVYLLALIHLTAFPIDVHTGDARTTSFSDQSINLVPFEGFRPRDFALNVLMTVPLGLTLPLVFRRFFSVPFMLSVALGVGFFFEFNQLLLKWTVGNDRFVDANDVIANTTGVLLGFWIAKQAFHNRSLRRWVLATLQR